MSHITTVTHHERGSGGVPASPDKLTASRRRLRHIGAVLAGSIVVAALLLVVANLAFAQSAKKNQPNLQPFLVEDIYPGKTGSEPNYLVDFKEGCCSQPIIRSSQRNCGGATVRGQAQGSSRT